MQQASWQDVYAALPRSAANETKACWKLFIRCITALACWSVAHADALLYAFLAASVAHADALLYAFLAALSKLALRSYDGILYLTVVVDGERSPRADQMN